jgi:sec-independent protein translocase protein TatB
MPQIGPLEIIVVAVLALLVFGPQRLPEIARTVGKFLNEARRMANEVKSEFKEGLDDPVEDEVTVSPPTEAGMTEAPDATPTETSGDDTSGDSSAGTPTADSDDGTPTGGSDDS